AISALRPSSLCCTSRMTHLDHSLNVLRASAFAPIAQPLCCRIDAAIDGQGIALARTALSARDLLDGRVAIPVDVALRTQKSYWIIYPKASGRIARLRKFKAWGLAKAKADAIKLGQQVACSRRQKGHA
ncbi:MAG: hypothetical protein NW217_15205, partial [Hyphomicrobiaceae bacterium]|nr:hypothetical protein [Hyphomicrobiaceae bacterium]